MVYEMYLNNEEGSDNIMKMTPVIDFEWEVVKEDETAIGISPLVNKDPRMPCCWLDQFM